MHADTGYAATWPRQRQGGPGKGKSSRGRGWGYFGVGATVTSCIKIQEQQASWLQHLAKQQITRFALRLTSQSSMTLSQSQCYFYSISKKPMLFLQHKQELINV